MLATLRTASFPTVASASPPLGQMGCRHGCNLVKAGHDVTVYNRTRAKAEALVAQGPYPK